MELLKALVAIVGGTIGILAALYRFWIWLRQNAQQPDPPPIDRDAILQFLRLQRRELEVWRLLDLHRDIHMTDVHVQEMLEVATPTGRTRVAAEATLADEVLRQVTAPRLDSDGALYSVHGHAGSGKTTMLRHWTLALTDKFEASRRNTTSPIPVYLSLRFLGDPKSDADRNRASEITSDRLNDCLRRTIPGVPSELGALPFTSIARLHLSKSSTRALRFLAWVAKLENFRITYRIFRPVARWIHSKQVRPIQWVVLCDGLDELEQEHIVAFVHWVRGLPPLTRAVVSMRPEVLSQANVPRTREFRMCNFNDSQVTRFAEQWFSSRKDLAESLLDQIRQSKSLRELSGIPLLLTFLCIDIEVHDKVEFSSGVTQSDVLSRIVRILLEEWDAARFHRPPDEAMVLLGSRVLSATALTTQFGQRTSREQLSKLSLQIAQELNVDSAYSERFVKQVSSGGQLLAGSAELGYLFSHKVFFDYFFAMAIVDAGLSQGALARTADATTTS